MKDQKTKAQEKRKTIRWYPATVPPLTPNIYVLNTIKLNQHYGVNWIWNFKSKE